MSLRALKMIRTQRGMSFDDELRFNDDKLFIHATANADKTNLQIIEIGDGVPNTAVIKDDVNLINGFPSYYNNTNGGQLTATTLFSPGTADFTIEMVARRTRRDADLSGYLLDMAGLEIFVDDLTSSNTNNRLYWVHNGSAAFANLNYMVMTQKYHVALTRRSGVAYAWLNGTLLASSACTTSYNNLAINLFRRSAQQSGPTSWRNFFGNMGYIRFISGCARYTQNFDVSSLIA